MTKRDVIRVADVIEHDFEVVDGITTVADALAIIRKSGAHFLIVDKRDDDDEYGIVLLRDIAEHVLAPDRSPERMNVYEIMSKPVVTVRAGMNIRYCARLFRNFGISTALVTEGDEIKGIVTYDQLVLKGLSLQA